MTPRADILARWRVDLKERRECAREYFAWAVDEACAAQTALALGRVDNAWRHIGSAASFRDTARTCLATARFIKSEIRKLEAETRRAA